MRRKCVNYISILHTYHTSYSFMNINQWVSQHLSFRAQKKNGLLSADTPQNVLSVSNSPEINQEH